MIIAGTTTFGTQGAVEYACREKSVQELLLRLSVSDTGGLKPFEALLHVKIAKGVPAETELVSLRKIPSPDLKFSPKSNFSPPHSSQFPCCDTVAGRCHPPR
jgi:hypothetical protein